jgi:hypothetical protein
LEKRKRRRVKKGKMKRMTRKRIKRDYLKEKIHSTNLGKQRIDYKRIGILDLF